MRKVYLHIQSCLYSLITVKLIYMHTSAIYFQSNGLSLLSFDLITYNYITSELYNKC